MRYAKGAVIEDAGTNERCERTRGKRVGGGIGVGRRIREGLEGFVGTQTIA